MLHKYYRKGTDYTAVPLRNEECTVTVPAGWVEFSEPFAKPAGYTFISHEKIAGLSVVCPEGITSIEKCSVDHLILYFNFLYNYVLRVHKFFKLF